MSDGLPDVVYLLKRNGRCDELRYSLRSVAANLPHRRVWLAGYQPPWTTNVGRIPVDQKGGQKWPNQAANLRAACTHPDVAERCVLFNDDFYVVEPVEQVPVLHRGRLADLAASKKGRSEWSRRIHTTADYLGPDALAYDSIHTPLPFLKAGMLAVLDEIGETMLFRSVYGNRARLGGVEAPNAKVSGNNQKLPAGPFLSTSDGSFGRRPGQLVRSRFPDPCRYEA